MLGSICCGDLMQRHKNSEYSIANGRRPVRNVYAPQVAVLSFKGIGFNECPQEAKRLQVQFCIVPLRSALPCRKVSTTNFIVRQHRVIRQPSDGCRTKFFVKLKEEE